MSLDIVELVIAIEAEFDIEIPNEEASKAETVGEMAKLAARFIESKRGVATDYQAPLAFIIHYLTDTLCVQRQKINTTSTFVNDLGLD